MRLRVELYISQRCWFVTFEEASSTFVDPLSVTIPDPEHSEGEVRVPARGPINGGPPTGDGPHRRWTGCTHHQLPACDSPTRETAMRKTDDDSMLPAYDFSGGVRGKYAERLKEGVTVREVGSHRDLTRAALERRIADSLIHAQQAEFLALPIGYDGCRPRAYGSIGPPVEGAAGAWAGIGIRSTR